MRTVWRVTGKLRRSTGLALLLSGVRTVENDIREKKKKTHERALLEKERKFLGDKNIRIDAIFLPYIECNHFRFLSLNQFHF